MRGAEICLGSDSVVGLVTPGPIVPESASRSRSESLGAGFPLGAGNNRVLIISSSGCSSRPMFGVVLGYVGPFAYHSVSERGIDRVGVGERDGQ